MRTTGFATALTLTIVYLTSAAALSQSVCDTFEVEYTTDAPKLTGTWPYYNVLATCSGNLTLENFSVDACVDSGRSCGQPAADAFCQYLGYDYCAPGLYSTVTATAPAVSLTGEWCTSPGKYMDYGHPNRTAFEAIQAQNSGPYCSVLSSVTCIRSRSSIAADLPGITAKAAAAPATAPAMQYTPGAAYLLANGPPIETAGRRMKGMASITA